MAASNVRQVLTVLAVRMQNNATKANTQLQGHPPVQIAHLGRIPTKKAVSNVQLSSVDGMVPGQAKIKERQNKNNVAEDITAWKAAQLAKNVLRVPIVILQPIVNPPCVNLEGSRLMRALAIVLSAPRGHMSTSMDQHPVANVVPGASKALPVRHIARLALRKPDLMDKEKFW